MLKKKTKTRRFGVTEIRCAMSALHFKVKLGAIVAGAEG